MKSTKLKILLLSVTGILLLYCSNSQQPQDESNPSEKQISVKDSTAKDSITAIDTITKTESEWDTIAPGDEAIRIIGRSSTDEKNKVAIGWSGTSITVGFTGTELEAYLNVYNSLYDVFVDGEKEPSVVINHVDAKYTKPHFTVVKDLKPGDHYVTLVRAADYFSKDDYFLGFRIKGKANKNALPPRQKHKIQFIGNSITSGYAVFGEPPYKTFDASSEDYFYGFAGQTALMLNAEAHCISECGHGLLRNGDLSTKDVLPILYERTTQSDTSKWNHQEWIPDLIFINLGTNDYNKGAPDSVEFVDSTVSFVKRLRSYYPEAGIIIGSGPMIMNNLKLCRSTLTDAVNKINSNGDKNVYRFIFKTFYDDDGNPVYAHPDKAKAFKDATALTTWIKETFGW